MRHSLNHPPWGRSRTGGAGLAWTLVGFAILLAVLMHGILGFYQEKRLQAEYGPENVIHIESDGLFRGVIYLADSSEQVSFKDPLLRQVYLVLLAFLWLAGLFLALRIRHKIRALARKSEQDLREQAERAIHDLKTPLSALKMVAEYPDGPNANLVPILQRAADRVEQIIQDLERRALASPEVFDRTPFLLVDTVQSIVTELRWNKKFNAIGFKIQPPSEPITAQGLPRAELERHLMNLLTNAMESCLETANQSHPGLIEIDFKMLSRGGVSIEIKDNGAGLTRESEHKFFQRGFSLKKGRLRGRGLYFARKFAESFGGRILLRPREDQRGAIAEFHIPKEHISIAQAR